MKKSVLAVLLLLFPATANAAANCSSNPNTLTNGNTADATQVMGNFNNLLNCANNNLAHNGANSDITSLASPTITSPTITSPTITGTALAPAVYSGKFNLDPASNNTYYTAISASTINTNSHGIYWIFAASGFNVAGGVFLLDRSVGTSTLTTLAAGTAVSVQLDGSGNFQVKQTTGQTNTIRTSWLFVPAPD